MKILDCESISSIYSSLEKIIGVGQAHLREAFNEINFDDLEKSGLNIPFDSYIFREVLNRFKVPSVQFDATCWFHLTRVPQGTDFKKGILSLNRRIDPIWSFLYGLVKHQIKKPTWNTFKGTMKGQWASLYYMKTGARLHWGPYAILVRDHAFKAGELPIHDYLRVPEIVEDICTCFKESQGINLLAFYIDNTNPCIVKFIERKGNESLLKCALYHLYNTHRRDSCCIECSTCFDGGGKSIPLERIIKVEFPNYIPDLQ